MNMALREAEKAFECNEVPVGAVAVKGEEIVARAHNQVETLQDATAHAELILITQVSAVQQSWRLDDITIYVTKEPCSMCAGAMVNARVKRLVFGMSDTKYGAAGGRISVTDFKGSLHRVAVTGNILECDCRELMQVFFNNLRNVKSSVRV